MRKARVVDKREYHKSDDHAVIAAGIAGIICIVSTVVVVLALITLVCVLYLR